MDPLSVPCQVWLSLTSPPTAFSFTPKPQPTETLLHSQIKHTSSHFIPFAQPRRPSPHLIQPASPTAQTDEHDGEVLGLGSLLSFFFFLLFLSFSHWVSGFGCIFFLYFSISFPISVLRLGSESNSDGESFQRESHRCDFRRVLQQRR